MRHHHLLLPLLLLPLASCNTSPPPHQPIASPQKIRVLLLDGFSNHNWQLNTRLLVALLQPTNLFDVTVSTCAPGSGRRWEEWARGGGPAGGRR
ncbi:MAG: hypothetical protein ACTHN5_14820, partial [Phycisphaerae bacterium]